jgi:hypothetical protein
MPSPVDGKKVKNPYGETLTTEQVIRSRMIEVIEMRRVGAARESFNVWTTNEFDLLDPAALRVPQAVRDHEMKVWSKARVMKRFSKHAVDVDRIPPDVFKEIVSVLVASRQVKTRAFRRYVDWGKVPDASKFGAFAAEVAAMKREVADLLHVNDFLDRLAKSDAAPKKPNGVNSSGGGKLDLREMSTYELLFKFGAGPNRRQILQPQALGTPPSILGGLFLRPLRVA